jgi:hypothetical protein
MPVGNLLPGQRLLPAPARHPIQLWIPWIRRSRPPQDRPHLPVHAPYAPDHLSPVSTRPTTAAPTLSLMISHRTHTMLP